MEKLDKNTIIGLVLLFLLYGTWMYLDSKNKPLESTVKASEKKEVIKTQNKVLPATTTLADSLNTGSIQKIALENDVFKAIINSKGGQFEKIELKKFKSYDNFIVNKNQDLVIYGGTSNSNNLEFKVNNTIFNTKDLNFTASSSEGKSTGTTPFELSLKANSPAGVIEKTISFVGDSYEIKESYKLNGLNLANADVKYIWTNELNKLENNALENRKTAQINYFDNEQEFDDVGFSSPGSASDNSKLPVKWFSFKQKYFTSGVIAENFLFENTTFKLDSPADESSEMVKTGVVEAQINTKNIKNGSLDFKYYFGPNDLKVLNKVGNDFQKNLYLGYDIVKPINKFVFVPLFNWVESFVKNYGLLIIIVVLIIKLAVTPLIYKSYISSAKMRILAPEINAIKEKVGDDTVKVQQETMKLYQQVGVSPLSGCVPMLLQMPILMSVFFLFPNMIMFRQKEFLWAKDLSTFDAPISWATNLPIIGNHISLFVVLMTISSLAFTYYNNQITPDQPGPIDMKKISYVMPLIFFFVLNSFPAALSFYYLVSNVVTIGQQLVIRKFIDEDKIKTLLQQNKINFQRKPQKTNKFSDFMQKQLQASEEMKKQLDDRKKTDKKK
jgi:YidC/Oxa1 family membrane protein insertase